ncbi:hypothetical protein KCV06_g171, partial [Aureobasidium melanogenum]
LHKQHTLASIFRISTIFAYINIRRGIKSKTFLEWIVTLIWPAFESISVDLQALQVYTRKGSSLPVFQEESSVEIDAVHHSKRSKQAAFCAFDKVLEGDSAFGPHGRHILPYVQRDPSRPLLSTRPVPSPPCHHHPLPRCSGSCSRSRECGSSKSPCPHIRGHVLSWQMQQHHSIDTNPKESECFFHDIRHTSCHSSVRFHQTSTTTTASAKSMFSRLWNLFFKHTIENLKWSHASRLRSFTSSTGKAFGSFPLDRGEEQLSRFATSCASSSLPVVGVVSEDISIQRTSLGMIHAESALPCRHIGLLGEEKQGAELPKIGTSQIETWAIEFHCGIANTTRMLHEHGFGSPKAFIVPTSLASRPVAGLIAFVERTEGSMLLGCRNLRVAMALVDVCVESSECSILRNRCEDGSLAALIYVLVVWVLEPPRPLQVVLPVALVRVAGTSAMALIRSAAPPARVPDDALPRLTTHLWVRALQAVSPLVVQTAEWGPVQVLALWSRAVVADPEMTQLDCGGKNFSIPRPRGLEGRPTVATHLAAAGFSEFQRLRVEARLDLQLQDEASWERAVSWAILRATAASTD